MGVLIFEKTPCCVTDDVPELVDNFEEVSK